MAKRTEIVNGQWLDKEIGPVDRMVFNHHTGNYESKAPAPRFISGPISFDWIQKAARFPGKTVHVALSLCFLKGVKQALSFKVTEEALTLADCSRQAYYNALKNLENANLITVERRAGCRAVVTLINFNVSKGKSKITPPELPPALREGIHWL